jgi:hypothetical protein
MESPQYCVYNQTSECFLSLGVTQGASILAHLKGLLAGRAPRYDEGKWVAYPRSVHLVRLFSSRDLVFLDEKHRVVGAIESFSALRFAHLDENVTSVLALPLQTISSSQTQPGNQLVICPPEELELRLRRMPDFSKEELTDPPSASGSLQCPATDRRTAHRKRWPRLIAYDAMGGTLQVRAVKDLSANGLYLITAERWPLGAPITMTLQRTDGVDDKTHNETIAVQLRVIRWGQDGVGLAFEQSEIEESPLVALTSAQ